MLTFGVAKSNFAMECGFGVTVKHWVKKAKCQGIVGGFMVIQMEMEKFNILLSLTILHLTINSALKKPCSAPHNYVTERDSRLLQSRGSMKRGQRAGVTAQKRLGELGLLLLLWVTVGKVHFSLRNQHLSYPHSHLGSSSA